MTFYHATKQAALDAGQRFASHWYLGAELEPHNGWVLVLRPRSTEVLRYPLHELLEIAELDLQRMRKQPPSYRRPPTVDQVKQWATKAPAPPPPPPPPPPKRP